MERFDVLVIGAGSGMLVASAAVDNGFKVAVVENGPMGGTCINRGCVPSKMLIYPADVIALIREVGKIDVKATVESVDFKGVMSRMRALVKGDVEMQAHAVEHTANLKWLKGTGEFTDAYTLKVNGEKITAPLIFIASGARVGIPNIKGLDKVGYLTSDTVLELEAPPKSLIILGGGYIGVEYGHFFSAMGTKVTIIQRASRILPEEEPEISDLLKLELQKRMDVFTGYEAVEVKQQGSLKVVVAKSRQDGSVREFTAEELMIAAGRVPNSDLLKPQKTGVKLDDRGYIKVNEFLETDKKNIFAFGDAIGKYMFKHVANYEASVALHNALHDHKVEVDYSAVPHAVFTYPQVASVGLKEEEAKQRGYKILVGSALYKDTAMGAAMGEPAGFVKVIVEEDTGKILGGHIVGPEASVLIQEIVNAMNTENKSYFPIIRAMHIHPALTEVVQQAFSNLKHT
ncbi:MAG: dihydrolipoyl dehydrogenase [Candidatus Bathyarchaeota archaeon]|nr:dihydrolipoyl dehydrogenase [Candidatus Bathyarchaeota archaeon]